MQISFPLLARVLLLEKREKVQHVTAAAALQGGKYAAIALLYLGHSGLLQFYAVFVNSDYHTFPWQAGLTSLELLDKLETNIWSYLFKLYF